MENKLIHADVWAVNLEDNITCYHAVIITPFGTIGEDLGLYELESDAWIAIENYESIR
jgi:hypothetical protein